jgi:hypothetical protein
MAKKRAPRRAPLRKRDPLDEYSTWDVRTAKTFYYATILASLTIFLGIWISILLQAFVTGGLQAFITLPAALQVGIVGGIFTLHLLLLVVAYSLFRGGVFRMCKILFPDRRIAKKFEDFNTLRYLIAVMLLGAYITIVAMIVFLLPPAVWTQVWNWWVGISLQFSIGTWVIWLGGNMLLIIGFFFIGFVLWSHGVFAVLKIIKRIEEEDEIDEEIKDEALLDADTEEVHKEYKKDTGKNAMYRGKETRAYQTWKKNKGIK